MIETLQRLKKGLLPDSFSSAPDFPPMKQEDVTLLIAGEGTGGAAGFATGSARVTLTDEGNGTLLCYEVNAQVGGKLAQIGSRLIDGVAKKLAREFFESFSDLLAREKSAAADQNEQIAVDPDVDRASLPVWLWASGVLAVAIGSLIYFSGILS